jgi:hypothetical protein
MKYFELIQIDPIQYRDEELQPCFSQNICPYCGDQLLSVNHPLKEIMHDWDEYEQSCDIEFLSVYKCTEPKCNSMFASMEIENNLE